MVLVGMVTVQHYLNPESVIPGILFHICVDQPGGSEELRADRVIWMVAGSGKQRNVIQTPKHTNIKAASSL